MVVCGRVPPVRAAPDKGYATGIRPGTPRNRLGDRKAAP